MTEKEAIDLFEKVHTLQEQRNLEDDIKDIRKILNQWPINMREVGAKIEKVNREHPENVVLFNLIFPPHGDRVSLENAPDQSLINDLAWKQIYLQAKKAGKVFSELCKEMRKNTQTN